MTEIAANNRLNPYRRQRWIALGILILALMTRLTVFRGDPRENDESLYRALVEQLANGHGYTLQGHPILDEPWVIRPQYEQPLFFHPPGGLILFWSFVSVFGQAGFGLAQWAMFALFYYAGLRLIRQTAGRLDDRSFGIVCLTVGFSPIMAHVSTHYWLDGPQTAWVMLCTTMFVESCRRRSSWHGALAGLALAAACWTKLHAVLALPGIVLVGWACQRRVVWGPALSMTVIGGLLSLPWPIWQWMVLGSPFPSWAGRPHPDLVAQNEYIHFLTVVRPWWIYFVLLPSVMSTLPAAVGMLWTQRPTGRRRFVAISLALWICLIVGVIAGLGAIGYSKLLRYVILVTPAELCLWALALRTWKRSQRRVPFVVWLLLALEWAHGLATLVVLFRTDLLIPLLWPTSRS